MGGWQTAHTFILVKSVNMKFLLQMVILTVAFYCKEIAMQTQPSYDNILVLSSKKSVINLRFLDEKHVFNGERNPILFTPAVDSITLTFTNYLHDHCLFYCIQN